MLEHSPVYSWLCRCSSGSLESVLLLTEYLRISSYCSCFSYLFVSFVFFWNLWSLWRRNRCYGDALPKAEESILWACFLSQRRLHRLLFATKNVSKKNIAYARLTHFRSFQIISVERLHPFWQKGHEFLFGSSGGFGGVVLFLPSLQVRQAISGFEAQQLQPPKKLGFREGANWIDLSGLHENRLNAQWRKFSHQPLSHSATLAEWLTQPLWQSDWVWLLQPLWQSGWVAEWLLQPLRQSGWVAECLSGCSSSLSGRVAEWPTRRPLWQSGCSSHSGRVAEWLLQPLRQSGWVSEWLLLQPLRQSGWVAEWLRRPLWQSGWVAEWLLQPLWQSGRVAEWLLQPLRQSGWVSEWLLLQPLRQSGWVAEWLRRPLWQSGWAAAPATLAEWLSGCISHSGTAAEWLRQSHQSMKWTDKVLNISISKQEYIYIWHWQQLDLQT